MSVMQRSNKLASVVLAGFRKHAKKTTSHFLRAKNPSLAYHIARQHNSTYVNNSSFHSHAKNNKLRIKRVLIVTKLTRYEFEKIRQPNLNDAQLEDKIRNRGTDYDALMHYHHLHKTVEQKVRDSFTQMGVEVKVVNRLTISQELLKWASLVCPLGGDGTFLLAASRATPFFIENSVPIVGFNSDPKRSEGRLMLPKQYTSDVNEAVQKIIKGDFEWMHRSRVRITLLKFNGDTPVPIDLHEYNPAPVDHKELIVSEPSLLDQINGGAYCPGRKNKATKRILPYLALNEVFIGETLSARVSHLHIRPNTTQKITKTKSSGLCVSTGTGSTSWHTSINRLSKKNVEDLLQLLKNKNKLDLNDVNAEEISEEYNRQLVFEPDDPRLCYSIREQICVGVWPNPKGFESRDFAQNLYVKSRCFDASLVIDGTVSYKFNDGTKALLEVLPEDALLTMKIED